MSDEDYEAFMKVSDLENRLAATKSNILKLKKSKIKILKSKISQAG